MYISKRIRLNKFTLKTSKNNFTYLQKKYLIIIQYLLTNNSYA